MGRQAALPERAMRRAEMGRWLVLSEPDEVAHQLDALLVLCLRGEERAWLGQMAFLDLCLTTSREEHLALEAVDLAAARQERPRLIALLSEPEPRLQIDEHMRRSMRVSSPLPLGTRRWKARLNDRKLLEQLMADPDPLVVAHLCANPQVREADIVAIAARRPNWPDVLEEVARSRWLTSMDVQRALAQNPFGRTGLAIRLLPLLGRRLLLTLLHAGDLHPQLLEAVKLFLAVRSAF